MQMKEERMKAFENWPEWSYPRPMELTEEGFYFTGIGDRVKCVYCNGVLQRWEQNDNPAEKHKKFYKNCPAVTGYGISPEYRQIYYFYFKNSLDDATLWATENLYIF